MTVQETTAHPNGVDIEAIRAARDAMTEQPELATFQWRATHRWVDGVHSRTAFEGYFGVGGEQSHRERFEFDADHPELFAAPDAGPTPVEFVLHGLASCITAGIASIAAHRGIELTEVTATVAGNMDLRGLLGIDDGVRNGYSGINVHYTIRGDASEDELRALVAQSTKRSAVFDVVTNPVSVAIDVSTS